MFLTRLLCCTTLAAQPALLHNRTHSTSYLSFAFMHSSASSSSQSSSSASDPREEHITLIGDSILDNKAYVRRDMPSVSQLLRKKVQDLNLPWTVTLCASKVPFVVLQCGGMTYLGVDVARAVDGDVMSGVPRQLNSVPKDTTVLVLSIGGNDGLHYLGRLRSMGMNLANFERLMGEVRAEFTTTYSAMLDRVVALGKKVPKGEVPHNSARRVLLTRLNKRR